MAPKRAQSDANAADAPSVKRRITQKGAADKLAPAGDGAQDSGAPAHFPKNTVPLRQANIPWLPTGWFAAETVNEKSGVKRRCFVSPAPEGRLFWDRKGIERFLGIELPLEGGKGAKKESTTQKSDGSIDTAAAAPVPAAVAPAEKQPESASNPPPKGLLLDLDRFALDAEKGPPMTATPPCIKAAGVAAACAESPEKQPCPSATPTVSTGAGVAGSTPVAPSSNVVCTEIVERSAQRCAPSQGVEQPATKPAEKSQGDAPLQKPTPARVPIRPLKSASNFLERLDCLDSLGFTGEGAKPLPP